MILPLMMAKRVPLSIVIEETTNAVMGISGPPRSVPESASFATGFQPIGQNGLRVLVSRVNEDLFFTSRPGASAAYDCASATKIRRSESFFIFSESRWRRAGRLVDTAADRARCEWSTA